MPKPPPFSRPSISLDRGDGPRRSWKSLRAETVKPGDTVAGWGLVHGRSGDELLVGIPPTRRLVEPDTELLVFAE